MANALNIQWLIFEGIICSSNPQMLTECLPCVRALELGGQADKFLALVKLTK